MELGCGLGLPSLAAAAAGARMLATDWALDALAYVRENAERNGVAVETLECAWGDPGAMLSLAPFAVVLASDVLYERINVPLLTALLPRLLAAGGEVLLADPGRPALPDFASELERAGWGVQALPASAPEWVRVLRLVPSTAR